jgi:hypothetical protein
MGINKDEQKKILKSYLGMFATNITSKDIDYFSKHYPKMDNYYIYGDRKELKKIGCYLLLLRGNEKYKVYNCYDLFNKYIGVETEERQWVDTRHDLVFLYYPAHTTSNVKLDEIISHVVSHRSLINKYTIMLTEIPLPSISGVFNSIGAVANKGFFRKKFKNVTDSLI